MAGSYFSLDLQSWTIENGDETQESRRSGVYKVILYAEGVVSNMDYWEVCYWKPSFKELIHISMKMEKFRNGYT